MNQKPADKNKIVTGLLGIFLGAFGAHKFKLGYRKEGCQQLLLSLASCGLFSVIGIVEGVAYLAMSNEQFVATYVNAKRAWF